MHMEFRYDVFKNLSTAVDDQNIFTTLKLGKSFENLPHAVDRFVDQKALQFFHINRVQKLKARENNTFIFDAFDWFFLSLFIHIFAQNQNSDTELKQHEEKRCID